MTTKIEYNDDLVQDCSISSAQSTYMMKLVIHLVNFGLYNEYLRSYLKDHTHKFTSILPLQWRRNGRDGVSNHRWHDCFSTLCSGADKKTKTSKLLVAGLCEQDPLATGGLPSQIPVTQKMLLFDDVIMESRTKVNIQRHHRSPVDSPHKRPVTRKMFPFDDVIMESHTKLNIQSPPMWFLIDKFCFEGYYHNNTYFTQRYQI